jgi:hypothetical protein
MGFGLLTVASAALLGISAGAVGYSIEQGQGRQDTLVQVSTSVQGTNDNIQAM